MSSILTESASMIITIVVVGNLESGETPLTVEICANTFQEFHSRFFVFGAIILAGLCFGLFVAKFDTRLGISLDCDSEYMDGGPITGAS